MKKLTAIILLTLILFFSFPHPTLATNISCDTNLSPAATLNAIGVLIKSGLTLGVANVVTSFLAGLPVVGGVFAPADQTVDFLYSQYLNSLLYGSLASLAVYLIGSLVQFALVINANLTTGNYIINAGYRVIYELVTFGFVIGIIIIAFATILRRSDWDAKSALVRLIIAALLINFGLFFAGLLLNISTEVTKVLVSNACIDRLVSQFNFVTLMDSIGYFIGTMEGDIGSQALKSIVAVFFASALSIIGALTLLGIFIFLMIRYVSVIILLIFMPIAWLGFVFPSLDIPGLGSAWKGWWKNFMKWIIYGPLMAFFLYLTVTLIDGFSNPNNQLTVSNAGEGLQAIGQLFVVVILSLGSLYAAKEMSGVGSGLILAGVGGAAVFAANKTQNLMKKAQFSALRQANRLQLKNEEKPTFLGNQAEKLFRAGGQTFGAFSKPAFQGPLRSVLTSAGLNLKGQQEDISLNAFSKKRLADASEKLKDSTSDELVEGIKEMKEIKGIKRDEPKFIASLQELAKRGDLNKIKSLDKVLNTSVENGFKDYNLKFKDIEIGVGMNTKIYEKLQKVADDPAQELKNVDIKSLTSTETDLLKSLNDEEKVLEEEFKKFHGGLPKKDFAKLPINDIYGGYKENKPFLGLSEKSLNKFKEFNTKSFISDPGDLNKVMPNMKSENMNSYVESILSEAIPGDISVQAQKIYLKNTNSQAIGIDKNKALKEPNIYDIKFEKETVSRDEAIKKFNQKEIRRTVMQYFEDNRPELRSALSKLVTMRETGLTPSIEIPEVEKSNIT